METELNLAVLGFSRRLTPCLPSSALEVCAPPGGKRIQSIEAANNARSSTGTLRNSLCFIAPIAEAMVSLGHTHDQLKLIADADWRTPESHPDLAPAHEALLLREHFTELLRTPEVQAEPEEFRKLLRDSELAANSLENLLFGWEPTSNEESAPSEIPMQAKRIAENCQACHVKFRDVPL